VSTNAIKNRNNQILLITIYIVPMHVKILTLNPQILFNKIHPLICNFQLHYQKIYITIMFQHLIYMIVSMIILVLLIVQLFWWLNWD